MGTLQAHIRLDSSLNIRYALLPGDPARLDRIALHLQDVRELAYNREFRSLTGTYRGGFAHRCGLVRSHDSFYTDEEMEICRTWSARGILGADMETAALYTIGRLRGMAAASILNNVAPYESDVAESVADYADGDRLAMQGEQNEIITALEAFVRWEEQYGSH